MRGFVAIGATLSSADCAGVSVVPPDLKEKVDWNVSCQQVKASPLSNKGKLIVVGGAILSAKPIKQNGTRIKILQLPLGSDSEPLGRLTNSKGRFLAFHKYFLDPAMIPIGIRPLLGCPVIRQEG